MSQAAKAQFYAERQAKRNAVLSKYAQAMPGMPGGQGLDMGGGGNAAGGDGLGLGALTVPTAADGNPVEEPADTDAMPEPGKIKPWGSVCPNCGGEVEQGGDGSGKCKSCDSDLKFTMHVETAPPSDNKKDDADDGMDLGGGEPPALGADAGLGAATAPAPSGAAAPGAPAAGPVAAAKNARTVTAGAPAEALIVRLSYTVDADVYRDYARVKDAIDTQRKLEPRLPKYAERHLLKALPVGMICPSCGDRNADKIQEDTFCFACGTMSKTTVAVATDANGNVIDGKLTATIRTIL
jgi:PPE-repeat protein